MRIRFAGIGFAHAHLEQFLSEGVGEHPEAELCVIADDDEARLEGARAKFDVEATTDVDAVLARDDVDAVGIASPNGERPALVAKALRAGKHVLCDKPLAVTDEGLALIRAAVASSGREVYLQLTERFIEPFVLLHEKVSQGALGRVSAIVSSNPHVLRAPGRPDWMWQPERYGGIICDLLIHRVDLVRWITGREIVAARGLASSTDIVDHAGFHDTASAVLVLEDGVQAVLHTNWVTPRVRAPYGIFTAYGHKGTAYVTDDGKELRILSDRGDERFSREGQGHNLALCDDFIRLMLEHYEELDPEFKARVPLRKIWVPAE